MNLKVLLPTGVLLHEEVRKVTVEAGDGEMALLPRHVDITTTVAPGVLVFETAGGREEFVAVGEGALVKVGDDVLVSARRGTRGTELGALRQTIQNEFKRQDEQEEEARMALAKIEATFVHRFLELEHGTHR
jgi:F-type H+-transporting ATPase subunit epsilon